jgi:hypothetical protein
MECRPSDPMAAEVSGGGEGVAGVTGVQELQNKSSQSRIRTRLNCVGSKAAYVFSRIRILVPEGRCHRSLARSAWEGAAQQSRPVRVRYDRVQLIPQYQLANADS